MSRFWRKWRSLSKQKKAMLCEALVRVSLAWFMIRVLPYSYWRRWLGNSYPVSKLPTELSAKASSEHAILANVNWAHEAIAFRLGNVFTCLMLGFSARAMLRSRGCVGILVLGVGRNREETLPELGAHAWVICESICVAGELESRKFTAVAAYVDHRGAIEIQPSSLI